VYVPFSGQIYCSPELEEESAKSFGKVGEALHSLPFDRVLGDVLSEKPSVLYADLESEAFRKFHKTLSQTAKDGKTSYRVRYRAASGAETKPLAVSGYGVELALKRTDYIVIDDRQAEDAKEDENTKEGEAKLNEEELSDLRPLSSSELRRLGLKAASFVMGSEDPFETLLRLSSDFPKHSSSIAATNVSDAFLDEHKANRELLLPAGYNVMWMNGLQVMSRDVEAYALLEQLRRERKMISGVQSIGLTGAEAVELLSHEAITESQVGQEAQRYDWRDEAEGGQVIVWLNNIEKDKRYAGWPTTVDAFLQRTYPGQLPSVRKEVQNLILPIDFSDLADATLVVESIRGFVERKLPIRFGLVPKVSSPESSEQAKVFYYLVERYGVATALDYLERSVAASTRKLGAPDQKQFAAAIGERLLRKGKEALELSQIAGNEELSARLKPAQAYLVRLGDTDATPYAFVNGIPILRTDEWLQVMSQRIGQDLRMIQQAIYEGTLTDDDYLPDVFLSKASFRRNNIVIPGDDSTLRHLNLGELPEFEDLPSLPASRDTIERELVHLTVAADFDTLGGFEQLMEALLFREEHDNVEVALLHVSSHSDPSFRLGPVLNKASGEETLRGYVEQYQKLRKEVETEEELAARREVHAKIHESAVTAFERASETSEISAQHGIVAAIGVNPGEKAMVINGRLVGPFAHSTLLEVADLEALFSYERKRRLLPAALAIEGLKLQNKASSPLAFARVSNVIAHSLVSDIPEGIFEQASNVRIDAFKKWNSTHTAIQIGDEKSANIQIYAAIDPASEVAQRWLPIIKVLSELEGVYVCLYLNPRERLEEIPVKRFYRHVISSKPEFSENGSLSAAGAHFSGLPADALLNMGMDLPPSWLVAPKHTVHDLDNIKLSAVKSGSNIDAVYELEHILIEGHSKDSSSGPPPRGVQLVLGTESDPHFADTIIMANLGYFQFKANPGIYNLALQKGRSEAIFNIDSTGALGYNVRPDDNSTEIVLMSFRGTTLFPELSRKPGMEDEDVLEASKTTFESLASNADKLLAQAGLKSGQAGKYLSKAAQFGSDLFAGSKGELAPARHADINIFSVASGHLYERMLNIMMVSVMKHTKHTVKFWFIEQFLSPSFKDFLPIMAAEYGFQYEMVTYKWPHWLRGQKEKQREIWGYKILFLDVLFPLDLDKVIFVDADQIVRTDMYELVTHDLQGAPYGFTPMCDSRTEMEGFRFWKQGYWKSFLKGLPYHISALYVVDLKLFRQMAAGDRLRQNYHQLSADPNSLSNLDQDLPNHMQSLLPIHSLPQEWLWCETWCSDESLKNAKTIDLCNNPQTKEPKLDRARRQVPEWTAYDDEIAAVAKKYKERQAGGGTSDGGPDSSLPVVAPGGEESIQERLQREDAERERKKEKASVKDEL
jgi:UDP-glucose:glycoprotein glucosyltransferase